MKSLMLMPRFAISALAVSIQAATWFVSGQVVGGAPMLMGPTYSVVLSMRSLPLEQSFHSASSLPIAARCLSELIAAIPSNSPIKWSSLEVPKSGPVRSACCPLGRGRGTTLASEPTRSLFWDVRVPVMFASTPVQVSQFHDCRHHLVAR